jgi:LPS-assembly lipoprotein
VINRIRGIMLFKIIRVGFFILMLISITSCGYHLRGSIPLAPSLHHLYLETKDPYGQLSRYLKQFLKVSNVTLTDKPEDASAVLVIVQETTSQVLLGISGTQQTRQYNLILTVTFQITDPLGKSLTPIQSMTETRSFTIKSDQILAGSNEASNLYNQMRQAIVYDIMARLGSIEITSLLNASTSVNP